MLKPLALTLAALTLMAACDGKPLTIEGMPVQATRFYANNFQDWPFNTGEISVISTEGSDLHTFALRPCENNRLCGERIGDLVRVPDYYVVTGAYAGRTFYLSPGGDGWVRRDGVLYPIAWN